MVGLARRCNASAALPTSRMCTSECWASGSRPPRSAPEQNAPPAPVTTTTRSAAVACDLGEEVRHPGPHVTGDRVQALGAVERDGDDAVVPFDENLIHGPTVAPVTGGGGRRARRRGALPAAGPPRPLPRRAWTLREREWKMSATRPGGTPFSARFSFLGVRMRPPGPKTAPRNQFPAETSRVVPGTPRPGNRGTAETRNGPGRRSPTRRRKSREPTNEEAARVSRWRGSGAHQQSDLSTFRPSNRVSRARAPPPPEAPGPGRATGPRRPRSRPTAQQARREVLLRLPPAPPLDEGLDPAEAGPGGGQPHGRATASAAAAPPRHLERDHGAEAAHLPGRQAVPRVVRQPRVTDQFDLRVPRQAAGQLAGVGLGPIQANREGPARRAAPATPPRGRQWRRAGSGG